MLVNIHHDSAKEHNRLLVAGIAFLAVDRPAGLALDRDLQQGLRPGHDGDGQGRPRRTAARQVRRRPDPRCPGRPGPQGHARTARRPRSTSRSTPTPRRRSPPTSPSRSSRRRSSDRSTSPSTGRPTRPPTSLSDGDVIPADRVNTNVELSQILADLFPLLRAVRPADLNATLNALSTALAGPRRADRRDDGRARRLPRGHRRPPPDAAAGPDRPRRRRRHLRPGRARPAQHPRQHHGHQPDHHREGRGPRRLLRGPGRAREDVDPDPARPTSRT